MKAKNSINLCLSPDSVNICSEVLTKKNPKYAMRNATGSPVLDSVSKDSPLLMLQGKCEDTSHVKSAEEEKPCNVSFSCRMSEKTHPSFPASIWVCGWQSQTLEGFRASSMKSPG